MRNILQKIKNLPDKSGYLLIFPFYLIFIYFCLIPTIKVIFDSFTNYTLFGEKNFIGLKNYIELFKDYYFRKSIMNTLNYTIWSLFPGLILGFFLAVKVNNAALKTRIARTILFLPHVISMVAISMVWLLIYNPSVGYMNGLLNLFGLAPLKWLQSPKTALLSIIIMSVWKNMGYNMIINLSGLQNIPESLYEVATIEGANPYQKLKFITIPMMIPTIYFLLITGIIGSFNVFEQVNIMTNGGPADATTTIVHQIYLNGFAFFRMGYASAQSFALLILIILITIIGSLINRKYSKIELE